MAAVALWIARGLVLLGLVFAGQYLIGQIGSWLNMSLLPHTEDMLHRAIMIGITVYIVLLATPFVPGAEIGLTLLTILGGAIAPLVYLATAASFMIAFLIGRLIPPTVLQRGLSVIGFHRATQFVGEASLMTDEDLRQKLISTSTPKFLRVLLRYRYVALAVAINTPGNVLLGGGGGIAMMAGLSRLYDPLPFLLTVLIAVMPIPLTFYLAQ